jgi:hypothetical protein
LLAQSVPRPPHTAPRSGGKDSKAAAAAAAASEELFRGASGKAIGAGGGGGGGGGGGAAAGGAGMAMTMEPPARTTADVLRDALGTTAETNEIGAATLE